MEILVTPAEDARINAVFNVAHEIDEEEITAHMEDIVGEEVYTAAWASNDTNIEFISVAIPFALGPKGELLCQTS